MRVWVALLACLALLLLGWTAIESARQGRDPRAGEADFQRLTGGLGIGSTAAIYWDFSTFDPRLDPDCACSLWPVPGGFLYSPEHGTTAWDPPEDLWYEATRGPRAAGEGR